MEKLNLEDILSNSDYLNKEKLVWYVAIIWRPNTWKSTFVNTLIWEKISITSNIPQTTRRRILAIYNDEESQIIFFDTPWIHDSTKTFNLEINRQATESMKDASIILYFVDSSREAWVEEDNIQEILKDIKIPIIKIYTKIDLNPDIKTEEDSIKISSVTKEGFDEVLVKIKENLKTDKLLFPEDYYTKQDMFFRVNEIIREKIFLNTKEEIPHSIYINTEEIVEKDGLIRIVSYIYTDSESQKYIIIWKQAGLLTKIWKESRLELEDIFWKKVFLALRVKTHKNWKKDEKTIKKII